MNIIDAHNLSTGTSIIIIETKEVVKVIEVIATFQGPKIRYQSVKGPVKEIDNLGIELYYKLAENARDMIPRVEVEDLLNLALATGSAYGDKMNSANAKSWIEHNLK